MIDLNIPAELRLGWIDWGVILLYFAALIYMGVILGKGQQNQEDYYVGGRNLPWWALGLSTMATQTSAISFISIPAFVALRQGGGMRWLQYEFALPLAMIFIMVLLIPFFRKLKLISIYEYLEMRFNPATRYLLSGVFLISRGVATAVGLYATAIVLTVCFNLPFWITVIIIGVVTILFDYIGGMKAVVYSDVFQMGILVAGIILCCVYAVVGVGGFGSALALFPKEQLVAIDFSDQGNPIPFWAFLIGGFFMYASYYGCDQSQTQRQLSAPTIDDSKKSLVFNGYFRFPLTFMYILMGVFVGAYIVAHPDFMKMLPIVENKPEIDYMLPIFILYKIPVGARAVIFSAIIAAAVTSLQSAINSLSASTMRDFLEKRIDFEGNPKRELLYGRLTTVFWGIFVVVTSFAFIGGEKTIVEKVNSVGSAFYGPVLASFILGVLFKRVNGNGTITGTLAGILLNLYLVFFVKSLSWMWWNAIGFFVTVIIAIIVSYLTPAPDMKKIRSLVIWHADTAVDERKWIPRYAMLVGYFVFMLVVSYFIPKWMAGFHH